MKRKTENFCRLCGGTIAEGFLAHAMECSGARLRALEAVARAAGPGHECGAGAKPKPCALCRALSRLYRVSNPGASRPRRKA